MQLRSTFFASWGYDLYMVPCGPTNPAQLTSQDARSPLFCSAWFVKTVTDPDRSGEPTLAFKNIDITVPISFDSGDDKVCDISLLALCMKGESANQALPDENGVYTVVLSRSMMKDEYAEQVSKQEAKTAKGHKKKRKSLEDVGDCDDLDHDFPQTVSADLFKHIMK
jgi:hypothetical protein